MKVCLIIPPRPYLFVQKALPYIGILMVSSALKKYGHDVTVLDFADEYKYIQADWYGITCTTADWEEAIKIRDFIRTHNEKAKIIIGGAHATCSEKQCLTKFNHVCVGDGEVSAPNIINTDAPVVRGILSNIDEYHPDKQALNLHDYIFSVNGIRATSMVTAYSCPYGKCAFCSRPPEPFNKYRFHSVEWCRDEIVELSNIGFKALMIYDDEMLTNPKRDAVIIDYLGEYFEAWRCFVRADYTLRNKSLVKKAADNNLKEILIGIESGSNTVLNVIEKGTTSAQNFAAVKYLSELGIKVKCAMIVGLPSESEKTLEETWDWCEKAEKYVSDWDFTTFTPLPGSKIYEHPEFFDIKFDKSNTMVPYKAMNTDSPTCPIHTKDLSFGEILKWRESLESRFKLKKVQE